MAARKAGATRWEMDLSLLAGLASVKAAASRRTPKRPNGEGAEICVEVKRKNQVQKRHLGHARPEMGTHKTESQAP
jgi:hypothetical protein